MQLMMRRPEIVGFIAVTPPATEKDFSFLAPCPSSGLIVHGEGDGVVPAESVVRLVDRIQTQRGVKIDLRVVPDANHFFTSHLDALIGEMGDYLDEAVGDISQPVDPV